MKLKFFNLAKKISKKSTSKFKLGCVVVNKNKIVGKGFNDMNKTHPAAPAGAYNTLHAEIHAILGIPKEKLKGCSVYVYRETKDGNTANSKPCPVCQKALNKVGIKKIYYTDIDGFKEFKL